MNSPDPGVEKECAQFWLSIKQCAIFFKGVDMNNCRLQADLGNDPFAMRRSIGDFQEPVMSQGDKQNRQAGVIGKGHEQKGATRPEVEVRAWAAANKLHGGGKKGSGRKVPFGPVGGLGRKTNLSRSS